MGTQKGSKQEKPASKSESQLRENKVVILNTWKERVKEQIPTAAPQRGPALFDSMPAFIDRLIEAMANTRSEREKAFQAVLSGTDHGEQRAELPEYSLDQVLIEYRILREVIFDVLKASSALNEVAVDSIDDSIQVGMSSAATEFLRIRMIRETEARREVDTLSKRLRGLQSVTDSALAQTSSLQSLLYELLGSVRQVFASDTVVILLLNEKKDALVLNAANGLENEVRMGMTASLEHSIGGKVLREKRTFVFEDLDQVQHYSPILKKMALKSLMGTSLSTAHGPLGVMHVAWLEKRAFTQDEALLLQMIADRIAVAIENSRLYEQREKDMSSLASAQSIEKRFLSILTYDIRNPMSSAQILAAMLRKKADNPEIVRTLSQRISTALGRSDKLIQDLLDVNKIINHDLLELEPQKVQLREIIAEAFVPLILLYGDRFILQGSQAVEGNWSRRELSRVIELLLDTGLRFGDENAPILVSTTTKGEDVRISFHFDGSIPRPVSLFSVPSQGIDAALAMRESRLSLNWTLIESFVKAHGGSVTFESSAERGTDVTVQIARQPNYAG
jgi:K+-sensing histidine kinase KdpD